jgi:hypothetical protein
MFTNPLKMNKVDLGVGLIQLVAWHCGLARMQLPCPRSSLVASVAAEPDPESAVTFLRKFFMEWSNP